MAVPSGSIIVADPDAFGGLGGVIAVHPGTGAQQTITQGGMLSDPSGLAVGTDGTIYVADLSAFGTGAIVAVDPANGHQTKISASTILTRPFGLAAAPDGRLIVTYLNAGEGAGKVMLVNPADAAHHGVAPTVSWSTPADVVVDGFGDIVVADADIAGFDSRLRRVRADGTTQDIRDEPMGVGAIYVGLAPKGQDLIVLSHGNGPNNQRVFMFEMGTPWSDSLYANGLLKSLGGVVVEPSGAIVVADQASGIVRLDHDTQQLVSSGGSLVHPIAVALAP